VTTLLHPPQLIWTLFAATWNLALCDLISVTTEESLYLICDFSAKVRPQGPPARLLLGPEMSLGKGNLCLRCPRGKATFA